MARFKCLSIEELTVLEKQFVSFLATQSILAADWVKIKETDAVRAQGIVEDFSDMVYGSVMSDAKYLELKTQHAINCYQCLQDRFVLIALEIDKTLNIDLRVTDMSNIENLLSHTQMQVFTTEKPYAQAKEDEVFRMMQLGCEITDGRMFKALALLL